jgi:hypothetical protein
MWHLLALLQQHVWLLLLLLQGLRRQMSDLLAFWLQSVTHPDGSIASAANTEGAAHEQWAPREGLAHLLPCQLER